MGHDRWSKNNVWRKKRSGMMGPRLPTNSEQPPHMLIDHHHSTMNRLLTSAIVVLVALISAPSTNALLFSPLLLTANPWTLTERGPSTRTPTITVSPPPPAYMDFSNDDDLMRYKHLLLASVYQKSLNRGFESSQHWIRSSGRVENESCITRVQAAFVHKNTNREERHGRKRAIKETNRQALTCVKKK